MKVQQHVLTNLLLSFPEVERKLDSTAINYRILCNSFLFLFALQTLNHLNGLLLKTILKYCKVHCSGLRNFETGKRKPDFRDFTVLEPQNSRRNSKMLLFRKSEITAREITCTASPVIGLTQ